jgi:hypothetical protein
VQHCSGMQLAAAPYKSEIQKVGRFCSSTVASLLISSARERGWSVTRRTKRKQVCTGWMCTVDQGKGSEWRAVLYFVLELNYSIRKFNTSINRQLRSLPAILVLGPKPQHPTPRSTLHKSPSVPLPFCSHTTTNNSPRYALLHVVLYAQNMTRLSLKPYSL